MSSAEVFVPALEQLLVATNAQHVRLSGLRFEHSTWLLPDQQGYVGCQAMGYCHQTPNNRVTAPAAIRFEDCRHVTFENNILQHTGASGLAFP